MARMNFGLTPDYDPESFLQAPDTAGMAPVVRATAPVPDPALSRSPDTNGIAGKFGPLLSAIGAALLSSPRNAPFQNLPQALAQAQKTRDSQNSEGALRLALIRAGMSPEDAAIYAKNPAAAQMMADQEKQKKWMPVLQQTMQNWGDVGGAFSGGDPAALGSGVTVPEGLGAPQVSSGPTYPRTGSETMSAGGALRKGSDPRGLVPFIQQTAQKYGIDPGVAVKVAQSEGLANPIGDGGKSGGAFQLYTGGGEGNNFMQQTGLDPLDPANEKETIDFALKRAAEVGWGPWHGAKRIGLGPWDGIGAAPQRGGGTARAMAGNQPATPVRVAQAGPQTMNDAGPMPATNLRTDFSGIVKDGRLPPGVRVNSQGEPFSASLLGMSPQEKSNEAASYAALRGQPGAAGVPLSAVPKQAPATTPPAPTQLAQSQPQSMTDATQVPRPTQQDVAQAQSLLPNVKLPQNGVVQGQTQRATGLQLFRRGANIMTQGLAFGAMGQEGAAKAATEYAKQYFDLSKSFLTPSDLEKSFQILPAGPLRDQAIQLHFFKDSPQMQGQVAGAKAQAEIDAKVRAAGIDPRSPQGQAMARNMLPDARPEAVRLSEAARQTGPEASAAIAGAIPGNAQTTEQKDYAAYAQDAQSRGQQPMSMYDWDIARRKSASASTNINTAPGFEAAQTTARIDLDKKAAGDVTEQAIAGQRMMPLLEEVIRLADKTPGGWSGPVAATTAKAFSAIGLPVSEGMSNAELLQSMSQRLVPTVREPGATAASELNTYLRAVPGLLQSQEGRVKVAEMNKSMVRRNVEIAKIYRENLGSPNLYEKLSEIDNKPLFNDEQRATIERVSGGSQPPAATQQQGSQQQSTQPTQAAPKRVYTRQDYEKIAPGEQYVAPDGKLRVKGQ